MFKQIFINGKETQYLIFDDGVIYNMKTHQNLRGSKSSGYIRVQLYLEDGTKPCFALHRLLAQNFISNPENKSVVHHIDGNPLNNKLENLMWVTQQENASLQLRVSSKYEDTIPVFSEQEIENEKWVQFRDTSYEVSSLGRKKNTNTGLITPGTQNKNNGYIRWVLAGVEVQAHRAVYEAFHPNEEIKEINHIDGNRANNRLENLENITHSENVKKAYYETKTKKTRYVAVYKNEELVDVYQSLSECARSLKVRDGLLREAIKRQGTCRGFFIKEIDQEFYYKVKLKI